MSALESLEDSLGEVFEKAPAMPENGKKTLAEWLPWISLVAGVLSVWLAYSLYHIAHNVGRAVDLLNSLAAAYGTKTVGHMGFTVWLAIGVLAASGVIYLLAFPGLRDRKKAGWNLMFLAALVNVGYGVVALFTDYDGGSRFVGSLVSSAVAFYLLFQIRSLYKGVSAGTTKSQA